jgi:hypothetical protein
MLLKTPTIIKFVVFFFFTFTCAFVRANDVYFSSESDESIKNTYTFDMTRFECKAVTKTGNDFIISGCFNHEDIELADCTNSSPTDGELRIDRVDWQNSLKMVPPLVETMTVPSFYLKVRTPNDGFVLETNEPEVGQIVLTYNPKNSSQYNILRLRTRIFKASLSNVTCEFEKIHPKQVNQNTK